MTPPKLVDHFFRHEYGKLIGVLTRRVGISHLDAIEDAVQSAMERALKVWTAKGLPVNPAAWMYRVAYNQLISELRQRKSRKHILETFEEDISNATIGEPRDEETEPNEDDLLLMLFVCCDESLPKDSQLVFALKILCGFSVREIAIRLFINESNVYKRLTRARQKLRGGPIEIRDPATTLWPDRRAAVNEVLYILFTEGYLSSHPDKAIRLELCNEALRLATILAERPVGHSPETFALVALMHLHVARMAARQDAAGGLILLEDQDRSLWDQQMIADGLHWLERSARGDNFTRYHAEAGIAAEHCLAKSYSQTRWDRIADCYEILEAADPSPIHTLNRAVAVAEWKGPAAGLKLLKATTLPPALRASYLSAAVFSDLHRRCGNTVEAQHFRTAAYDAAPTVMIKELLARRLADKS